MTEYVRVDTGQGLILMLTRPEFFRALDRSDTRAGIKRGDSIIEWRNLTRHPDE